MKRRFFMVMPMIATLAGCGSADQRRLEDLVAEMVHNPPNLVVNEAIIYRDGERRMACLTAQWDNNWGERQEERKFIASYNFESKKWSPDGPDRALDVGYPCDVFAEPDWKNSGAKAALDSQNAQEASSKAEFQRLNPGADAAPPIGGEGGVDAVVDPGQETGGTLFSSGEISPEPEPAD